MSWLKKNWKPVVGTVLFTVVAVLLWKEWKLASIAVAAVGAAGAAMGFKKSRDDSAPPSPSPEAPPEGYTPAVAKPAYDNWKGVPPEDGVQFQPKVAAPNPNTAENSPSASPVPPPPPTPEATAPAAPPEPPATPPAAPTAPPPAATAAPTAPPSVAPPPPTPLPEVPHTPPAPPTEVPHTPPAPPSVVPHSPVAPRRVDPPFGDVSGDDDPVIHDPEAALPAPAGVPPGPEVAALPPTQAAPPCAAHGVPNCPACGSELSAEPADPGRRGPMPESGQEPALPPLDTGFGSGMPDDPAAHATVAETSPPALVDQVQAPLVDPPVVDPEPSPLPPPEPEHVAGSELALADLASDSGPVTDDPVETG